MLTYIKAQSAVFEPEEIIILVGAFDKAWHTVLAGGVRLEGDAEPVRAILAKHIIESASRGELNQEVIQIIASARKNREHVLYLQPADGEAIDALLVIARDQRRAVLTGLETARKTEFSPLRAVALHA